MLLQLLLFRLQKPFFLILIFSQDFWGNLHHICEINLISSGNLKKAQVKQYKSNLRLGSVDERQLKTIVSL